MKDRDIARAIEHQSAIKKERDEVLRLKAELEKAQSRNTELEKSLAEEKQLRTEETRKLKESTESAGSQLTSVQHELEELTKKTDAWLVELCRINGELNSEFLLLLSLYRHSPHADIGLTLVLEILYSGHFPHSQPATDNIANKDQAK